MLTFDAAKHEYRWDGNRVPSVTQVLKPLTDYSMVDAETLERARAEGVAIHKMVELYERDDLGQLPAWLEPYIAAWMKFKAEMKFRACCSEAQVYHPTFGYAGTYDLDGHMGNDTALVDLKRSFMAGPAIGLQLAAYLAASEAQNGEMKRARRFALQLRPDGTYRLQEFTDKTDFQTFLAALTLWKWRAKHGAAQ